MREQLERELAQARARLESKGLFDGATDVVSMRWPGKAEMLLVGGGGRMVREASFVHGEDETGLHSAIYRARDDAGALLTGHPAWSGLLADPAESPPMLFDEQARHIGTVAPPLAPGDVVGLLRALRGGSNVCLHGEQWTCVGTTGQRMTLNAEVFEKCARAFAVARATGRRIETIPWWVRVIAGGRLRRDQKRAAESLARGQIPSRVRAY